MAARSHSIKVCSQRCGRFHDEDLRRIAAPTLLVNAEDDQLTPLVGSQMLKNTMPNSLLHVSPTGGAPGRRGETNV